MMPLETKDVAYPLPFAGYQLNSRVPVRARTSWTLGWKKRHAEAEEEFSSLPYSVQIKDDLIAVRSENDLFFYSPAGAFLRKRGLNGAAPVILGDSAYAYLHPSYQLTVLDYRDGEVLPPGPLPRLREWSSAYLLKPSLSDVLAVVQFSGGPSRRQPKYFAYKFLLEDGGFAWYHEFDGSVGQALLSGDGGKIVMLAPEMMKVIDAASGDIAEYTLPEAGTPLAASLDPEDNLIAICEKDTGGRVNRTLQAWSLDGGLLWSWPLAAPSLCQPPACGSTGRVYIVDAARLQCLINGQTAWSALLAPAENNWITVTVDDHALVLNGSVLCLFDPDGKRICEYLLTEGEETFHAPAAVDGRGRIYVAGDEALYCLE